MINGKYIREFFDAEAKAQKENWSALMKLPLKERIRKRKAIDNVTLDKESIGETEEGNVILKVHFKRNLSDFKEGDCLLLHRVGDALGIECTLYEYENENTAVLNVFPMKMPENIKNYYDKKLVLDKNYVDLRPNVFNKFSFSLPIEDTFWKDLLFNSHHAPTFSDIEDCKQGLAEIQEYFGIELTPNQSEAVVNSVAADDYYLIQGPPGTGKSFVLALVIILEILFRKHKVVIVGPNHMAVNNALIQTAKVYMNVLLAKIGQSCHAPRFTKMINDKEYKIHNITYINADYLNGLEEGWVVGSTPHSLYTRRAQDLKFDTLIIDEAGQMTIPLAMMGMVKGKKVVMAGDHKQLAPIIASEDVPDCLRQSAFEALLQPGNYTLLNRSFRMCAPICDFVSSLFYDGKVEPASQGCGNKVICQDALFGFDAPIVLHDVDDNGLQVSDTEARFAAATVAEYIKKGLGASDVAVIAPFRAQVAAVRRAIMRLKDVDDADKQQVAVETVDKMQGQEREVIIYTMTAGDAEYAAEMADFLYNANKLNVAFSRAKSKLIIVGNVARMKELDADAYAHIHRMLASKQMVWV
ncbi:MAG: DEAD/DEAH box helicase [Muribaculaceae bacterium]